MTEPQKCPHCAKAIDFGKLAKQNAPNSVKTIDGVRAGLILKDIPALIAEHLGDSTADNGGSEYTITLSNLKQTKAITLIFNVEGVTPRTTSYYGVKGKNGETASFVLDESAD